MKHLVAILLAIPLLLGTFCPHTTTAVAQQQQESQTPIQQPEQLGALVGPQLQPELQSPPQPTYPCDQLDRYLMENYPNFFLLLRLINIDIQSPDPNPPGPALNTTAFNNGPVTILAPQKATTEFLLQNNIDVQRLIRDPTSAILLAPSLGNHFLYGYYPTPQDIPRHPESACQDACSRLTAATFRDETAVFNDEDSVKMVTVDVANCPGQWVIHEVDGILLSPTEDEDTARQVGERLTYGLGGEFDTFKLL